MIRYIPVWLAYGLLVKLPAVLFGVLLVPIGLAVLKRKGEWPSLLWLWWNDEEGIPKWWLTLASGKGGVIAAVPRFWWLAIRNPANNLRYTIDEPDKDKIGRKANIGEPMEAGKLSWPDRKVGYRWLWSGWLASYRRVWLVDADTYREFYVGFKIASSTPGVGFTVQWRKAKVGE